MPTKKSNKRVAKSAKKSNFTFKWWMGVLIVAVVAVVGLIVLRFSNASTGVTYTTYLGNKTDPNAKGGSYVNSKIYDQGRVIYGWMGPSNTTNYGNTVNSWQFTSNDFSVKLCGHLQTTNFKSVTSPNLSNGSGPYNYTIVAEGTNQCQ